MIGRLREIVLRTGRGSRMYWNWRWGRRTPAGRPDAPWVNRALKRRAEWEAAVAQVRTLGLPPHRDPPKNWDSLAAVAEILRRTEPGARVLDAGAMLYSVVLPWLALYGYRDLWGLNLEFRDRFKVGPIAYEHGDLTHTRFDDAHFDAITCMSVIEHNVPLEGYFKEMARLLKKGGILVTSADYFEPLLDTAGRVAYGGPVRVFSRDQVIDMLAVARRFGLEPTGEIDYVCEDKPVTWKRFDLSFTFVVFTLQKG